MNFSLLLKSPYRITGSIVSIVLILLLSPTKSFSQTPIKRTFKGEYHMLSPDELSTKRASSEFTSTKPPSGNVRNIAEFEPNEGVIVEYDIWGFGIPLKLIAEISEDVNVVTIVKNTSQKNDVLKIYLKNNVDTSNCKFLFANSNSYWSRDYSPWFIEVDGEVALVDFPYNRPRPQDDSIPIQYAKAFDLDLYGMNLVHTGGNWMCDGMGIAASTNLVYEENTSLSSSEVDSLVSDYLGINQYHVTSDPQGEYIKHIDCWGKFLDVDKILIAKVSDTSSQYKAYEDMATYWASQTSSYGNNYQVFRVYSPNGEPYTNALIMNDKVMVPMISENDSSYNAEALNTYKAAMPGYEVMGFYDNGLDTWESTDALHCRTHEIPDRNMLYIKHEPLLGKKEAKSSYTISADIIPYSKKSVTGAKVYYSLDGGEFNTLTMDNESGDTYVATITNTTSRSSTHKIAYYIVANDESGRTAKHPFIGSADPHVFYIESSSSNTEITNNMFAVTTYPTPCADQLFVSVASEGSGEATFEVFDLTGIKHISKKAKYHAGKFIQEFNTSQLSRGMYVLVVGINGQKVTRKILVDK